MGKVKIDRCLKMLKEWSWNDILKNWIALKEEWR